MSPFETPDLQADPDRTPIGPPRVVDPKRLFGLRVSLHSVIQAAMGWQDFDLHRFGWTMRLDGRVVLSTLLALHFVAYATGTLVLRYPPGYWAILASGVSGGSVGPTLSAAVSAVEERYPALILAALE